MSFWKQLRLRTKALLVGGLAAVLLAVGPALAYRLYFRDLPAPPADPGVEVLRLNNDVWTEEERQRYYHLTQGSEVMPYDWFVALEQGDNDQPFIAGDNVARFRFIPDPNTLGNPDRLPVGFARGEPDPVNGVVHVGVTCAACHTAQVTYKGQAVRVDGAPGKFAFDAFREALVASLGVTAASPVLAPKFERFARRVLKGDYSVARAFGLKKEVLKYLAANLKEARAEQESDRRRGETPTAAGFGRIDALGAGGNRLYRLLGAVNLRTLNAPVKALPLWNTHEYNWVETNGSMRQPMARNIIQALSVKASLVLPGSPSGGDRYVSSARLKNMFWMESVIRRFKPPAWPESVLGKLDPERVARGEAHYERFCATCHTPRLEREPQPGDTAATKNGKRFFALRLLPVERIGTDPTGARNFAERTVDASAVGMGKNEPGANVIRAVLDGVISRQYKDLGIPPEEQAEWNGYRDNLLRACAGYQARPLAGVWAAAPYLHNGSVPNLYQLLLPAAERDKVFYTGSTEFDPVRVGYETAEFPGAFRFDTSLKGNSNAGHQFGTSLSHEERMDLIEYLKALKFPEGDYETADPQPSCP